MSVPVVPGDVDILILCGGAGTRLRPVVSDRPKSMAAIAGRPFLDMLIGHVSGYGFRRFILCTGHMKDTISAYYSQRYRDLEIVFSEEEKPLGTAGAVREAEPHIRSSSFIVMNGDSFCPLHMREFLAFHHEHGADISIVLSRVKDAEDYGIVECDSAGVVVSFLERGQRREGLVNAGVYAMQKKILTAIPAGTFFSLEHDLFPSYVSRRFYGYVTDKPFIDIGTPERYAAACTMFAETEKGRITDG